MQGIADYEFVRPLGESNYGTNYLAKAPARLGIGAGEVVVKVIAGPTSDDAFRRATRELKHFSVADSDRLVAVYDAGRHGGAFYYAMEFLPLGSLEKQTELLIQANVMTQLNHLAQQPAVAEGLANGTVRLHGWVYDIATGEIIALDNESGAFLPITVGATEENRRIA